MLIQLCAKVYVRPFAGPSVFRYIRGEMIVPHYMTNSARPGSTLVIDVNNNPVFQVTNHVSELHIA